MTAILLWSAVVLVATVVIWQGSGLLETASERLSRAYRLPEVVQGAVVVAVGSSFPELSTTVIAAAAHGAFELGVAAIVGSALFNILVIPALSGLASRVPLRANRDLVYKEAQFYMIAVAVLTLTFAFAIIYNPLTEAPGLSGEVDRRLAVIPVALYGLYLFLQVQDSRDQRTDATADGIVTAREWGRLAMALLLIVAGVEGLLRAALRFGEIFQTPDFLWGLTVVAAGTSVPDAFVSVRAARAGRGIASVANVLGSNTFDLLICIPAGVLVAGAAAIDFSVAVPMMAVLTFATILLLVLMRTRMVLTRGNAVALLVAYAGLLLGVTLETFTVIDIVPGLPPVLA